MPPVPDHPDRDEADELEHHGVAAESWWWWGSSADGATVVFVGLLIRGRHFDYRAGLLRPGAPAVYVEELDGSGRRAGLELKPPEMWADHGCDVPYRQWSVGNEAHGVLLNDARDALVRPYGTPVPVTFDMEWYSVAAPVDIEGGYEQAGEIDAVVELVEGPTHVRGPGHRLHVWGDVPGPDPVRMLARVGWPTPTVGT